ncbi:MAG: TIGR01212 family radical SAM protein [Eubacteriaceae bacterium]|nr:TIGR01212 family radical SAM protein [Eubacteriaceae bacterium]
MNYKNDLYYTYSEFLLETYGEKVYKIPVSISNTCPNRDGKSGWGGCIFCGDAGAGHETLSSEITPLEQFKRNSEYISRKYKANKFIVYFQDFTNTYMDADAFRSNLEQVCVENVVGIAVSTRPDCINHIYLDILKVLEEKYNVRIYLEMGLQTVNYHSLIKINRGHTLAEFIDAVGMIKGYGFEICAHLILNLPWDDEVDIIEGAKILSALKISSVKLHALYIEKNTAMAEMYENNEFKMIDLENYVNRVVSFLEYLSPDICIQRLIGRVPQENSIFANWDRSWWIIKDMIEDKMKESNTRQGAKCHYLGGAALR